MSKERRSNAPTMVRGPMGGAMNGPSSEKATDFKGTIKKLIAYMKPFKFAIILSFILAIVSTLIIVVGPKISGEATNVLFDGVLSKIKGGSIDFERICQILLLMVGLYIVSTISSFVQGFLMSDVAQKVSYNLRDELSKKINKLPFNYFDRQNHGEILSRVTNDVDTISQTLNQALSQLITSAVQIIGIPIMMLTISWQLTLMSLIIVPLSMILIVMVVKKSQKYFTMQQKSLGNVNGHIEEMYSGHLVMKAFNGEEKSVNKFKTFNKSLYESAWKSQFLSGLMQPISTFVGNLGYVGVVILGAYLAMNGTINIGDIQAFIQYVRSFNQPIAQVSQSMNVLQSTAAAAERVFEFLAEEEEEADCANPQCIYDDNGEIKITGTVTFENVHFGYNPDNIIINDFSMYINAGKKVAIVGPTGAGKTTIVKLLMRFYELNSGTIYVDGVDVKQYTRNDLRALFGMVLQDAYLFNGTIMDNLRYGRLSASDEEVISAADAAYVDHFIRTLDHGYETVIDEDSGNISQGQKQLLTIARAFLADPKILILDEATSSVDTRTEVLIQKGMEKLMENRTSFVIAHRLSTIKDADVILVMKDGDIVEVGDHDELIKRNGFYTSLYNSQFENND